MLGQIPAKLHRDNVLTGNRCVRCLQILQLLVVTLLLLAFPARSEAELKFSAEIIENSGIDVEVDSPFTAAPDSGFLPLNVTIKNHSQAAREWHFVITIVRTGRHQSNTTFRQALAVESGTQRMFEVLAPLANSSSEPGSTSSYASVVVRGEVHGYGIRRTSLHWSAYPYEYRKEVLPFIMMSPQLHLRSWPVLAEYAGTLSHVLNGGRTTLTELPRDWRAYTGLSYFFLTADEFRSLEPGVQSAIMHWVSLGGRLKLFHVTSVPRAEVNYGPFTVSPISQPQYLFDYGIGNVSFGTWDGLELGKGEIDKLIAQAKSVAPVYLLPDRGGPKPSNWNLFQRISAPEVSPIFLGILMLGLIGYALLVGPINLFVLAKRQARTMLFFTTPALSLLATLALTLILLLREGVGGWGMRTIGVFLVPESQTAFVTQEQLSKTSLLFDSSFSTLYGTYVSQLTTPKETQVGQNFSLGSTLAQGDWFSNRARQAQVLHYSTPTRAQLELRKSADGTPTEVFSNINTLLEELYVIAEDQQPYHALNVAPGQRVTLTKVPRAKFEQWRVMKLSTLSGHLLAKQLAHWADQPNQFIALTRQPTEFNQQTLQKITWRESETVFYGSLGPLKVKPAKWP